MAENPPSEDARQRAVDVLCEAFADDLVSVEEFERRVERAHGAASEDELRALLADLPRSAPVPARPADGALERPGPAAGERGTGLPALASPGEVAEHSFMAGIMGGGSRKGRWIPARNNWAMAVMGGVELDFRDAIFGPGVTEVRVLTFWGGVEIIVPPTVRVEVSGTAIMAGFDHQQTVAPTRDPEAPVLRVSGLAVMAGVEVAVRHAGESSREARRRLKEERNERKRVEKERGTGRIGAGPEPPHDERG